MSESIRQAYALLESVMDGSQSQSPRVTITHELQSKGVPLLRSHLGRIEDGFAAFRKKDESYDLEEAPQSLIDDVHAFRHFLLNAERQLNDKQFGNATNPGDYGTDIKRHWMTALFANDPYDIRTVCDITDSTAHQEEAAKIVHTVRTAHPADGARQLLAEAKVRLSSTSKGVQSALLDVMEELSNASRYEMLAKVDLYIRSGHAEHDLKDGGNPDATELRAAIAEFQRLSPADMEYATQLDNANTALLERFRHVFLDISIRINKSNDTITVKNHGTLAQAERASDGTAPTGHVDAAILNVDGKTLHAAVVSSNQTMSNMVKQGQQLARYTKGLQQAFEPTTQVEMTALFRAQHPNEPIRANSERHIFFKQIGVNPSDLIFLSRLDQLQVLTALTAYHHFQQREDTRFLMVGKDLDWTPADYKGPLFAAKALQTLLPILEKITHPDTVLRENSHAESLIGQTAEAILQVINVINDAPETQAHAEQFHAFGVGLKFMVATAKQNTSKNIDVRACENLSNALRLIESPAPALSTPSTP